jgi:putative salt-induced outer membrane protein YdiY
VRRFIIGTLALAWAIAATPVLAQAPAQATEPPPPAVTGNVSFGLGVTSGNKDTSNLNGGYEFKYDPKTKNVVKSNGLFLYGKTDGELSNETYGLAFRDEYNLNPRAFVFGEARYLHDRFKGIRHLVSPTSGVGYKVVDSKPTALAVSGGIGIVWEQDYGVDSATSGAVSFDEKFSQALAGSAAFGQSFSALWKMKDFGDALYLFGVNVTASLVGKAQLKVELLDSYKTRPPVVTLQSNDVSFITSVVYKF